MIQIKNLHKSFQNHEVLNIKSLTFPDHGLFILCGPSGSGKSTLLHILSGLEDYQGKVNVLGHNYSLLNDEQKDLFRLKNIGFVFQDFKLFENETVKNNILFPLISIEGNQKERQNIKVKSLLEFVNLTHKEKQNISDLSGGEKQRVALARALINNPSIILADEPTGALDQKSAKMVMDIFKKISSTSLVILVSHDRDLAKQYGEEIIHLMDGKITKIEKINSLSKDKFPISLSPFTQRKPSIPIRFLYSHFQSTNKKRKWRSRIVSFMTSLGLIGIGLALTISQSLSNGIKKAYQSLVEDNQLVASHKPDIDPYSKYAGSYYEAYELMKKYPEYIYDIGVTYDNNFEAFFPDDNYAYIAENKYTNPINKINARHINEYQWLDLVNKEIYPERVDELNEDQVVVGLSIDMIQDICFDLQIERTVTSLSLYLQTHSLHLCFAFTNKNWSYMDEQIVEIKGFTLEKNPCLYHYDHLWNEYMFESRMRFPVTDDISGVSFYPWTLKKIYYFNTHLLTDDFISFSKTNADFDQFILEIANVDYFPRLYENTNIKDIDRVLIFANTRDYILPRYYQYFSSLSKDMNSMILGSEGGIFIYPNNLLMGFARHMFFSSDYDELEYFVGKTESLNDEEFAGITSENNILIGHYSKVFDSGVNFSIIDEEQYNISNLDDIYISSKMAKALFNSLECINEKIYISCLVSTNKNMENTVQRKYQNIALTIKGVIDDDDYKIYHNYLWPITFFQCRVGVSIFNLLTYNVSLSFAKKSQMENTLNIYQKAFPKYEFSNPLGDITNGVDTICFYLEVILSIFSLIAVIISCILLSVCNGLYIAENKKDIGLARCLGINKKESFKFPLFHSVLSCFYAYLLACIELLVVSFIISYETGLQLGGGFSYYVNPLSFICMGLLAFILSLMSALNSARKINKLNPLEALKQ